MIRHGRHIARTLPTTLTLLGILASPAFAAPAYTVTNLTPIFPPVGVNAFNNTGEFVTGSHDPPYMPFIYQGGFFGGLPTLGGDIAVPNAINDNGQITGESNLVGDVAPFHAFLYSNGTITDLGTLGGPQSSGNAINAAGDVAGDSEASGTVHAFLYSQGNMTDLGDLGGGLSGANGINSHDQVVGGSRLVSSDFHAFLYSNGAMTDLGTLGGADYSAASAINDSTQIVGGAHIPDGTMHAFLYANNQMVDLTPSSPFYSFAWDINNSGAIVGEFQFPDPTIPNQLDVHAFLYANDTLTDLNSLIDPASGYLLTQATHINDDGQIIVEGADSLGNPAQLLLTPVPEPTTLALLFPIVLLHRKRQACP